MKQIWRAVQFILLVTVGCNQAFAYVDSPPLRDVVSASVQDCTAQGETNVHLITWGADEYTIYGNGGERKTEQGSIFAKQGLKLNLVREDVFSKQVEAYLRCESPYLRGTNGMLNMAAEVTDADPRTKIVVLDQLSFSAGGDALVVKEGIKSVKDLKGKTIAVQAYGPHVYYMTKLLKDAGLTTDDVTVIWTKDLVGYDQDTPVKAFYEDSQVDAAFVIIPDGLALTSNGTVGTGSEDSVRGAKILVSTKTANRVIADVYGVRADYFAANRDEVMRFVHGLMLAEEAMADLVKNKASRSSEYRDIMTASADILLDAPDAIADAEGMYLDAEHMGWIGNVKFFGDPNNPRNFDRMTVEVQDAFLALGLLGKKVALEHARWDYEAFKTGLANIGGVEVPKFDQSMVAQIVTRKQQQGTLAEGELFRFEVYFRPNQNTFPPEQYAVQFDEVINLASTYGGALITVEGHSDGLGYLKKKKAKETDLVLSQTKQSAKNLSLTRSNAVRDSVMKYAEGKNITLDSSQFAVVGHGFMQPANGMCGDDPCPPKTEQEWRNNMRVEFRIIQVEAESSVFTPL